MRFILQKVDKRYLVKIVTVLLIIFSMICEVQYSAIASGETKTLVSGSMTSYQLQDEVEKSLSENSTDGTFGSNQSIGCNVSELIDAINYANSNPGPDVIELSSECKYEPTSLAYTGTGYESSAFPAIISEITINGNNATLLHEHNKGEPYMRAFVVKDGGIFRLNNLSIIGFIGETVGGAIWHRSGTLIINNSYFSKNLGGLIGGAIASSGSLTIKNSTFFDNIGGAIYGGDMQISNSIFIENHTKGYGGAIEVGSKGEAIIYNSTFYQNIASG